MCKTRMDILQDSCDIKAIGAIRANNNKQFARNGQVFIDSIDERTACASKPCTRPSVQVSCDQKPCPAYRLRRLNPFDCTVLS